MAGTAVGCGGCRGAARPRISQRSRAVGDHAGIRRDHLPRGDGEVGAEPRAGFLGDAFRLDDQPVPRMYSCMRILFRAGHARVPRARCGQGLRLADRRQDQRGGGAAPRARQADVAARPGAARHEHRPLPAGRGPLPAHAGHHRCPHRVGNALFDPHEGHAAATRSAAAGRGRGIRSRHARDVDRGLRRCSPGGPRAGDAERRGAAGHRAGGGGRGVRGDGLPHADPAAPDRLDRSDRRGARSHPRRRRDAGRVRRAAPATGGEGVVPAVALTRAPRTRVVVSRALPGRLGDGPQGLPHLARTSGAPAAARLRAGGRGGG